MIIFARDLQDLYVHEVTSPTPKNVFANRFPIYKTL